MNYTITIAREFGSGGREIAKKLSEILNIPYYDKESLINEAKKYNICESELKRFDAESDNFYFPNVTTSYLLDMELSQIGYMTTLKTIQLIASSHNSIIVGRCADHILSDDKESVLKVFICAPLESRINRVMNDYKNYSNKQKAEDFIKKTDKRRKKYYEFISDKEWGNPLEYDLVINSDMGILEAANTIACAVKNKFKL